MVLLLKPSPNFFAYFVRSEWFPNFILMVIIINALWIGIEIEFNDPKYDWGNGVFGVEEGGLFHGMSPYMLVENIFCVIFTFEVVVRICAYRDVRDFFRDHYLWHWNVFDGILVGLMIFENWVVHIFPSLSGGDLKMFSIFRLLRLMRLTRIIRTIPELATMIKALAAAARSVGSTMLLMVGMIYVFAIIFTQYGQNVAGPNAVPINEEFFGTLALSSLTLLQALCYDDAMAIIRQVLANDTTMGLLFIFFMIFGSFTILNMLIGVICEIVGETKSAEEERIMRIRCKELFQQFDFDLSGTITQKEYEGRKHMIETIGLAPEICRMSFVLGDLDNGDTITLSEFIGLCFKLTGPPSPHDILMIKRNLLKIAHHVGADDVLQLYTKSYGNCFDRLKMEHVDMSDDAFYFLREGAEGDEEQPKMQRTAEETAQEMERRKTFVNSNNVMLAGEPK